MRPILNVYSAIIMVNERAENRYKYKRGIEEKKFVFFPVFFWYQFAARSLWKSLKDVRNIIIGSSIRGLPSHVDTIAPSLYKCVLFLYWFYNIPLDWWDGMEETEKRDK